MTRRRFQWLERALIAVGVWLLASVWIESLEAEAFRRRLEASAPVATAASDRASSPRPALVGRLEIPRLGLAHIVAEGESDAVLGAAIGHLSDTPMPWERGNSVLAGHRDGVFRPLKDIRVGDELRLTTGSDTFDYRVTETTIVRPTDTWILEPSAARSLTLITCYPFTYVGPAPYRFVVKAEPLPAAWPRAR